MIRLTLSRYPVPKVKDKEPNSHSLVSTPSYGGKGSDRMYGPFFCFMNGPVQHLSPVGLCPVVTGKGNETIVKHGLPEEPGVSDKVDSSLV